jgi:hypothetical protein
VDGLKCMGIQEICWTDNIYLPRTSGEHMLLVNGCEEVNLIWQFCITQWIHITVMFILKPTFSHWIHDSKVHCNVKRTKKEWFYTSCRVPASFPNIDDQCLDSLWSVIFPISKDLNCLGKVSVLFVFLPYKPDRTYKKCERTGGPYPVSTHFVWLKWGCGTWH